MYPKKDARRGYRERVMRRNNLEGQQIFPEEEKMFNKENANRTRNIVGSGCGCLLVLLLACLVGLVLVSKPYWPGYWNQPSLIPAPIESPITNAAPAVPVIVCPNTTEEAKALFGVDVQRIDTESCAWVWRGKPLHTLAVCPVGYICTFDALNDITVVHYGIGQSTDIYAGTWRLVSAYPPGDKVYDICALYQAEKQFGQQEVPSFEVRYQGVPGLKPQSCP